MSSGLNLITSCDALLGGAVYVHQPKKGYRVSSDAVFLAALAPVRAGMTVCELGTGYGQVALCLLAREPQLNVWGVEKNHEAASLARLNAAHNDKISSFFVHEEDLETFTLKDSKFFFDVVLANPPYRRAQGHDASPDPIKAAATIEKTPLLAWTKKMASLIGSQGYALMIHEARRLDEIINCFRESGLKALQILPLCSKAHEPAGRVVVLARAQGDYTLMRPDCILHNDDGTWKDEVKAIMASPQDWSSLWSQDHLSCKDSSS